MSDVELRVELRFNLPKPDEPGFLRRVRNFTRVRAAFADNMQSPDAADDLVNFFLDYLDPAIDRELARETLFDLSEEEFNATMTRLSEAFEGKARSPAATSNGRSTAPSVARGRRR